MVSRGRRRGRLARGWIGVDEVPGAVNLVVEEAEVVGDRGCAIESVPRATRTLRRARG